MACVGDFSQVPNKENIRFTAKWKVTIGDETYALVVQRKGSIPGVYDNAPRQFKYRFKIDASSVLDEGKMIGTLKNVTADDEATYRCELEFDGDGQLFSYRGQGTFNVYKKPELDIQNVNNPLNLETYVELDNGSVVKVPIKNEVFIAICTITDAYTKPVAIKWTSTDANNETMKVDGDFLDQAEMVQNPDKSWKITSDLMMTPDFSLHLMRFQCSVDLGDYKSEYSSDMSERLLIVIFLPFT